MIRNEGDQTTKEENDENRFNIPQKLNSWQIKTDIAKRGRR